MAGLLAASAVKSVATGTPEAKPFRFVFLTDLHMMRGGAQRSAEGIAACLQAVGKLDPQPDFLLVGGDLIHDLPSATFADGSREYDLLLDTWYANTSLPAHWVFGNHDLASTSLPGAPVADPLYAKGLFRQRLGLSKLFYSFDHRGWHFVVLDDVALLPDRNFEGRLVEEELAFLHADLAVHAGQPTVLCTHIPLSTSLAFAGSPGKVPIDATCHNATALTADFPRHNIRAVLAGHLHRFEKNVLNGVPCYTAGAVCGNWWSGPLLGCPEGFAVIDAGADGSLKFDYRGYGWKVAA